MNIKTLYPFPAIVGQEELKLSLILNAINPGTGGVLIRGEKGTAKSTAVRSLASLLPEIEVVAGCLFGLNPEETAVVGRCEGCCLCGRQGGTVRRPVRVVTLPLNATEDRLAGGIDFEKTTRDGKRTVQPGLLAKAHRGILYVDEVNLLDDHLVDVMLEASASGENRIEREGVSLSHPARFILVGTMNPEEGDLRPQLLDRFGLCVEVKAEIDREMRVTTMEQRESFDAAPATFIERFAAETQELAQRIEKARRFLPKVQMPGRLRALISELCTEARVAGHRADLIIEQAARALAAFSERLEVEDEDITRVAQLALRHRQREPGPPPPPPEEKQHDDHDHSHDEEPPEEESEQEENPNQDEQPDDQEQPPPESKPEQDPGDTGSSGGTPDESKEPTKPANPDAKEKVFEVGATFKVKPFNASKDRVFRRGSGRRSRSRISGMQGRYVKSTMPRGGKDVALDATLRAAAPYQRHRQSDCAIAIRPEDIREKVRERRIGNFLLFVVDASGSMGARGRMTATKGAIMSLLLDAYQKRDKVAMISFNKTEARLNLPPTSSIDMAARLLAEMPVGGRTPLNAALVKVDEVLRGQLVRDPTSRPIVVLITDGRSNVAIADGKPIDECLELARRLSREERVRFILVDTEEQGLIRFGLAVKIAEALKARYFQTAELKADTLIDLIKE
ncbi:MAG: magnesium chelatase subunit [Desulfobulbaceae bacterium]|nr:MAG: magnesium chelatase subunit [Desulfobulbaceae bacterium]